VYHYKTTPSTTLQTMSHTVLTSGRHKQQNSNTLFNQWSGTLEVYWETMMSKAVQRKCNPSNKINPSTNNKKTSGLSAHRKGQKNEHEDGNAAEDEYQKPVQVQRMKSGSSFIDAKFIFK
jgi:hypothetical protein